MSFVRLLCVVLITFWLSATLRAQPVPAAAPPGEANGLVQLNIPPDSELRILIEYELTDKTHSYVFGSR